MRGLRDVLEVSLTEPRLDFPYIPRTLGLDFRHHVYCLYVVSVEADHSTLRTRDSALAGKPFPYFDTLLDTITMIRFSPGAVDLCTSFWLERF